MNGSTGTQGLVAERVTLSRWHTHLDPVVTKADWLPHEDAILDSCHSGYGNQWSVIAKALPGRCAAALHSVVFVMCVIPRTEHAIKNRWIMRLKTAPFSWKGVEQNIAKEQGNPGFICAYPPLYRTQSQLSSQIPYGASTAPCLRVCFIASVCFHLNLCSCREGEIDLQQV